MSRTMRNAALLLVCLTCASHGRRAQPLSAYREIQEVKQATRTNPSLQSLTQARQQSHTHSPSTGQLDPVDALAVLLLASNPAAAFHSLCSGRCVHLEPNLASSRPTAVHEQSRLEHGIPVMTAVLTDLTKEIKSLNDTDRILDLVQDNPNTQNMATAMRELADINIKQRAARDRLQVDKRYELLVETLVKGAPEFTASNVCDILYSSAFLGQLPPQLLMPTLKAIATLVEADAFDVHQYAEMTRSMAYLKLKPVKLLEQFEDKAGASLDEMTVKDCASLLWGFSLLQYLPAKLLSKVFPKMLMPGTIANGTAADYYDLTLALEIFSEAVKCEEPMLVVAKQIVPDIVTDLNGRHLVRVISGAFSNNLIANGTSRLPDGLFDDWLARVRKLHAQRPLWKEDQELLEKLLAKLGMPYGWIKKSAMLTTWSDMAVGRFSAKTWANFTDDEIMIVFNSIDTDGSGNIDTGELKVALQKSQPLLDNNVVEEMMKIGDVDGDNEISFWEFKQIVLNMPTVKKPKPKYKGPLQSVKQVEGMSLEVNKSGKDYRVKTVTGVEGL